MLQLRVGKHLWAWHCHASTHYQTDFIFSIYLLIRQTLPGRNKSVSLEAAFERAV